MSKSLISGLQDALKEKRKKVERCEASLAEARADVANYVAKISGALGLRVAKKCGPKKNRDDLKAPGDDSGELPPESRGNLSSKHDGLKCDPPSKHDEVLRLEHISQLRKEGRLPQQSGVRGTTVRLATTEVAGHTHEVVLDRMGDGSTQPDSTGHGHRFYRFDSSQANKHSHGLVVPRVVGAA